jgi:hypothetical protein
MLMLPIQVTFDDIVKGIINSPSSDPVALAMQRAGLTSPLVGLQRVSFLHGSTRVYAELSPELKALRKFLAYGDRFEALEVIRDRKGNITGHKPVQSKVKVQVPESLGRAA